MLDEVGIDLYFMHNTKQPMQTTHQQAKPSPPTTHSNHPPSSYFGVYANATRYGLPQLDVYESPAAHAAFVAAFKCYNCAPPSSPAGGVGMVGVRRGLCNFEL